MNESDFSSGIPGAIPDAMNGPGRGIVLAPGLNGTVRPCHAGRPVHPDHQALQSLLFLRNSAVPADAGGTVVLSPSGPAGTAIGLLPGYLSIIIVHRPALAAAARGLTRSRFDPMPLV